MKLIISILISILLISCSSRYLSSNGTFSEDRESYIRVNWTEVSQDIKSTFLDAKICVGMPRGMIIAAFGPPDNNDNMAPSWFYTLKNGSVGEIKFKNDIAIEISENLLETPVID